jgi:hypothetical protein
LTSQAELILAVKAAQAGDCEYAHNIAQAYQDDEAKWLHAALHKMEGDVSNSRYWYARTQAIRYEDFTDSQQELTAIANRLSL